MMFKNHRRSLTALFAAATCAAVASVSHRRGQARLLREEDAARRLHRSDDVRGLGRRRRSGQVYAGRQPDGSIA